MVSVMIKWQFMVEGFRCKSNQHMMHPSIGRIMTDLFKEVIRTLNLPTEVRVGQGCEVDLWVGR